MEIHEALRYFRKKSEFTQKEVLPDLDASVYSRIEGGKQNIKINDLKKIMSNLSITTEEISSLVSTNEEQQKYLNLFYVCSQNLKNQTAKEKMLLYYGKLENKHKNLRELSNYIAIKSHFHRFWEEITQFTSEESAELYQLLIKKKYYLLYDYKIITNIISLFNKKQIDLLMVKVFRVVQKSEVKYQRNPISNMSINVITLRIYEKDYEGARNYIVLAKKYGNTPQNFYFSMILKYFENLLDYLESGEYYYLQRIYQYIELLRDVDDPLAIQIDAEVKLVIHGILDSASQNKVPMIVLRDN